jgi:purine catabolism regulator
VLAGAQRADLLPDVPRSGASTAVRLASGFPSLSSRKDLGKRQRDTYSHLSGDVPSPEEERMRLRDVLALEVVQRAQPELLAGEHLLDRDVRWVHTSELAEAAHLLKGGELLLTTGLGLAGRGPVAQKHYVAALSENRVSAVAFELGWTFDEVPPGIVAAGRELDLPVIALHNIVPFVEITEAVQSAVLEGRYRRLRLDSQIDGLLQDRLLEGSGPQTLVADLAEALDCPVLLEGISGPVIAAAGLASGSSPRAALKRGSPRSAEITVRGRPWGRLHLLDVPPHQEDLASSVLRRAPSAIALAILRDDQAGPLRTGKRDDFLELLVSGRAGSGAELALQAAWVGLDAPVDGFFLGIAIGDVHREDIATVARATRDAFGPRKGLTGEVDGVLLGVFETPRGIDTQALADSLYEKLLATLMRHRVDSRPQLILGPAVHGLESIGMSLREARSTLMLCTRVGIHSSAVTSRGMAADRLLGRILEEPMLTAIIDEQIGVVLRHDAEHGGRLAQTLWTYLIAGAAKTEAAEVLHIRRQSLYKRLAKIRDLVGDIDDPQRRLALLMTLRAHSLLARQPH